MSVLVYAISRDDARAPAAPELQEICAAGLRALAEPVQEPLTADLAQLVHYEETVETVMATHTILPMRFGSVVEDEHRVRALLKAHVREFAAALAHLDGAVEFGVQVSCAAAPEVVPGEPAAASGAAYLRGRLIEQRARRELRAWLDENLLEAARERAARTVPSLGPAAVSAAYLVENRHERAFVQRLTELADGAERRLTWSGPWPPYSFVGGLEA
ncbi:MAG TPA: GvpL/GvpF family gas vesicle protein [Solirubrobacteraceae bacterium]|nr:GvpL/GvpF family gas vesicle protein [Solirubrobacteraceae bacterium]